MEKRSVRHIVANAALFHLTADVDNLINRGIMETCKFGKKKFMPALTKR